MTELAEKIKARLESGRWDNTIEVNLDSDMPVLQVSESDYKNLIRFLKEDEVLDFHFLTTLCGLHYPDSKQPFGLMVQLHNFRKNERVRIKTFTADAEPQFGSLTDLWPSANWMERETYDFFGYRFTGHPGLRRILNMDSLEGWPLRKEFPLEDGTRKDKDDRMFGR